MDAERTRLAGAHGPKSVHSRGVIRGRPSLRVRRGAVSVILVLVAYGLVSSPLLRVVRAQQFLPSYEALGRSYWFLLTTGTLARGMVESVLRMMEGYAAGAAVGIAAGAVMGAHRVGEYVLDPLVQIVKFTPALAWLPLYMIWFGTGQVSMVMLIATGVAVVMLTATYHGVSDVGDVHLRAARMLGAPAFLLFRRVVVPAALLQIFDGLRVAIAVAWAIIVAAELVGAPAGLGYLLVTAREYLNIPLVLVVVAHIGLVAFLMDVVLMKMRTRTTRWMRRRLVAGS